MNDNLIVEIAELAKNHTGATSVTPSTRLYADLGMTGDDARGFMLTFAASYEVDLGDLVWLRYFDDENTDMLAPAAALAASVFSPAFAVRWQAARDAEREITIAHLAEVARAKTWIDPGETFRRERRVSPLLLVLSVASALIMGFFLLLGAVVAYGFLAGQLGDRNLLALVGIALMGILFPLYLGFASWRTIQCKLASA